MMCEPTATMSQNLNLNLGGGGVVGGTNSGGVPGGGGGIIPGGGDGEDPYPSLSDYHDYEPNLEFDDTELEQVASTGTEIKTLKTKKNCTKITSFAFVF